jgi:glycosyltransferase involved in cell wall biosynthesis
MRVLQVYKTPFPAVRGGVDVVVSNLLRQPASDCECLLLRTAEWTLRGVQVEHIDGVKVIALHLPVPPAAWTAWASWWFLVTRAPLALWRLRSVLREHAIDVVHLHTLQFYQLYFVLCRWFGGPPFVVTLHRAEVLGFHRRHVLMRACWRLVLKHAAAVTAVSAWLTAEARRQLPFVPAIEVITNGIAAPDATLPKSDLLRQSLRLPARYLCMVGVLEAYKGHDVALHALTGLDADCDLVVIGSGSLLAPYRALCERLGIAARVHFVGQLAHEDTLALLRDSLALVMPSRNEGLGLVVLEAGMLGVPVIASDIEPFREMLSHETTALLFATENADALTHAARRLLSDAPLRARLAQQFRARVGKNFTFASNARRYAQLYRRVLDATLEDKQS